MQATVHFLIEIGLQEASADEDSLLFDIVRAGG